jgi:hypothetical protein
MLRQSKFRFDRPVSVYLCVADHFEPKWGRAPRHVAEARVERWISGYRQLATRFTDSAGQSPQHTFFYPIDEYEPSYLDGLKVLCKQGFGDVEVHLHHDNDSSAQLRETLTKHAEVLFERHGLLRKDSSGRICYGFIHGNWALDNSRADRRWCGVNDELTILRETGCYADFTMPSAPDPCQVPTINQLYFAIDDPQRPCSHAFGLRARVGTRSPADGLLMVPGPLAWNWSDRIGGWKPRLENGDLTARRPPTIDRFRLWCAARVMVIGNDTSLFIKLHTHGAQEANSAVLLGEQMAKFHTDLADFAQRHREVRYFYVTAFQMYQEISRLIAPRS